MARSKRSASSSSSARKRVPSAMTALKLWVSMGARVPTGMSEKPSSRVDTRASDAVLSPATQSANPTRVVSDFAKDSPIAPCGSVSMSTVRYPDRANA